MNSDFDWLENKENIIVPAVDAIAVYTNEDGNIVIRQQNPMGDDDYFVVIPLNNVPAVIKAVEEEAKKE